METQQRETLVGRLSLGEKKNKRLIVRRKRNSRGHSRGGLQCGKEKQTKDCLKI